MIQINADELLKLATGLDQYKSIMPKSVSTQALRNAVRPMFRSAQRLAPSGRVVSKSGWGKNKGPEFARGGATRRDIRIKLVPARGQETARVIVGVSKKSGKVGWRTHFITRGFTDRGGRFHRPDNFLQNAYDYTIEIVRTSFQKEVLLSFRKWARRNLPKGRF
ncbi:hypothetical protein [Dyadobacter sp. Leaf189]|uniref:hypothetical protein n=1 Tax=Dyadobacter sp. Leaf189 TaxID=1736295 RepID=UPI0006F37CD5|nr:hypothetical protein [Dyadobacter sp. Leaf189]KQS33969.1 hypothetical protein ASG33_08030 [Dyadobacter sp. Leaf189]